MINKEEAVKTVMGCR